MHVRYTLIIVKKKKKSKNSGWQLSGIFFVINVAKYNARVKGHLEPTYLKCSPLFTFSTKLLGQDSPSIHLFFSKILGSRFTTAKIKLDEDSPN